MVTLAATLPVVAPNNNTSDRVGGGEGIGSDGRNSGASGGSDEDSGGLHVSSGADAEFQRHERNPSTENVEPTYDDDDDDVDDDRSSSNEETTGGNAPTQKTPKPLVAENDSDGSSTHDGKLVVQEVENVDKHHEEADDDDEDEDDGNSEHLSSAQQIQQQAAMTNAGNAAGLFGADFSFPGVVNSVNPALLTVQPPFTTSAQSTLAAFEALRQQIPNGNSPFLPQTSTANSTAALFQQVAARALAQLSMQQMGSSAANCSIQQQQLGLLGNANALLSSPATPNGMGGFDANIAAAMAAFGFGPAAAIPPAISSSSLQQQQQQQNDVMSSLLLMPPTTSGFNNSSLGSNRLKILSQSATADVPPSLTDRHLLQQNRPPNGAESGSVDSPNEQNNPDEESTTGNPTVKRSESSSALLLQYSGESGARDATPMSGSPMPNTWSFEEQFKSLYDIDADPERKRFLDELFVFMQKKGSPINRIPIMAKQTLDLHKLYRLVIQRGGLVEVINKKQWREITKGLNLPSSITSAAFTLRTQYAKYLYPYECEKHNFSTIDELQSAIDGNKREGRRSDQVSTPSLPSSDTAAATLGADISSSQPRHHTPAMQQQLPPPPPPSLPNSMAPSMAAPANTVLNDALRAAAAARSGASSSAAASSVATHSSVQQHLAHLMNNNNGSGSMDQHMNAVNQLQLMMNSQQPPQNSAQQLSFAEQMRKSSSNSSPASDETAQADLAPAASTTLSSRKRAAPNNSSSTKRSSHLELLARHLAQQSTHQQHDQHLNSPAAKRLCTDPYESLKLAAVLNQQHQQQQQQHLQASIHQAVQAAAAAAVAAQAGASQPSVTTTTSAADVLLSAHQQQQQQLLLSQQQARNLLLPGLNTSNNISNTSSANGLSTCNMKITPRGDSRNPLDSSMVVSMEINGILYQGVLFAHTQPPPLRL